MWSRAWGTFGGGGQSERSSVPAAPAVFPAPSLIATVTLWVVIEQLLVSTVGTEAALLEPLVTTVPRTAKA